MTAKLNPMHHSVLKRKTRTIAPKGMASMRIDDESRMAIERLVLEIFTDMSNAGCSLQQTLTAIYLTGMDHAASMITTTSPPAASA